MNSTLKNQLELLTQKLASEFSVSPFLISVFIQQAIIATKISLLSKLTASDITTGTVNLEEICQLLMQDVAMLGSNAALSVGVNHIVGEKILTKLDLTLTPLLQHYFIHHKGEENVRDITH